MVITNFSPFPCLSSQRIQLREITFEDNQDVFALRSDERVMKYIDRPIAKSMNDTAQLIQLMLNLQEKGEAITWAITLKDNPKLIGTIGFWRIDKEHYRAEIGYLLHPDFQGKGMMQEAISLVLNYGFTILKLHSVEANVNPLNLASIKLVERNKFVREAYFKENYFFNGKFLDTAIYSLLTNAI